MSNNWNLVALRPILFRFVAALRVLVVVLEMVLAWVNH